MNEMSEHFEAIRRAELDSPAHLAAYVAESVGLRIPAARVCPGHASPLDYLWHSFACDWAAPPTEGSGRAGDSVVWANRGGGKTLLAALATLLDALFKPGCEIRLLGGSGQQSSRVYEYLRRFLAGPLGRWLEGPLLKGGCRFRNGAAVEVLTQSATSVRGTHVHKLRCDELELFDPDVLAAAKFTTVSTAALAGSLELVSTLHRAGGLMEREVAAAARGGVPVFRWCLWETIAACRRPSCGGCPLADDCGGRARAAQGYLTVDDALTQRRRSSRSAWEAEMLCLRPSRDHAVFPDFDPAVHVRPVDYDVRLPLYRAMDFGYVAPFVCLWLQPAPDGTIRVLDEYLRRRVTLEANLEAVLARTPCAEEQVAATCCDPAGASAEGLSGSSAVAELRRRGVRVRYRASRIAEGLEAIRRALRTADGTAHLVIAPTCTALIEALRSYRYPDSPGAAPETPLKDGVHDHPIDALRYFFVHHARPAALTSRPY